MQEFNKYTDILKKFKISNKKTVESFFSKMEHIKTKTSGLIISVDALEQSDKDEETN
jgi:hypothetical protein